MSVDLYRLDSLKDYDAVIAALPDFIVELVEEFVPSPEGTAYLKANPEMAEFVGSWIDSLIYFGYAYESVTLPNLNVENVELIVTKLFPQKISLLNPEEAETTIPELIAFWQFLKRECQHPQATPIIKFLKQIQPKFSRIMNDPSNFGIAKSFFTAGETLGFEMKTQEGLTAFQEHCNNNLGNVETSDDMAMLQAVLQSSGIPLEMLNPLLEEEEDEYNFEQEIRERVWQAAAEDLLPITEEAIAILQQQKITDTQPGTILHDFQVLLDFIGDQGAAVSSKQHCLSRKTLTELNQRLSSPINIALKSPQQKSYPSINGLYLLLRASGIGQIIYRGKKPFLILDSQMLAIWENFNSTERYFTLLEAWMIRAHEEILGDRRSPYNEGTKCLEYWIKISDKGEKFANYQAQQSLSYWPEFHNLALMELFGFVQISSGKPTTGKGWRIRKVQKLPFGEVLMQLMVQCFTARKMRWKSENDPYLPYGEFQPAFQTYFPQWQKVLTIPKPDSRSGLYTFKVSLDSKTWRRIVIASQMVLADFSSLILEAFEFDSDHLDMFRYKNLNGRTVEISHPYSERSPSTDQVAIADLNLKEGTSLLYIFDFGDWWEFNIQLEKIDKIDKADLRSDYGAIVESKGDAPPQYPGWEED